MSKIAFFQKEMFENDELKSFFAIPGDAYGFNVGIKCSAEMQKSMLNFAYIEISDNGMPLLQTPVFMLSLFQQNEVNFHSIKDFNKFSFKMLFEKPIIATENIVILACIMSNRLLDERESKSDENKNKV